MDSSEDAKLSIRDLPGMVVGDWRLEDGQMNEQHVEDLVEIDEAPESSNSSNRTADAEYVVEEDDQIEIEVDDDGDGDGELENDDLEDGDDDLYGKD